MDRRSLHFRMARLRRQLSAPDAPSIKLRECDSVTFLPAPSFRSAIKAFVKPDMSRIAPLAFLQHNHGDCRETALNKVRKICKARQIRLTPVRERVLELLWDVHEPMRAYDILEKIAVEGFGSQPPVVYRALDFLIEHGFAHKIERLNAFVACDCPGADHGAKFLICTSCNRVAEFDDKTITKALGKLAEGSGFAIGRATLEVEGICPDCRSSS